MHPIIYDVAVSIDGFIAGTSGDVSSFPFQGPIVDDYMQRLAAYSHCIMGRNTYEFGYQYGLEAGQNPYPHMRSVVFSKTLKLPVGSAVDVVAEGAIDYIKALKQSATGDIYLCGGGDFAAWLMQNQMIDILRLKRAPILLGQGTRLLGGYDLPLTAKLLATKYHEDGIVFQEFDLNA